MRLRENKRDTWLVEKAGRNVTRDILLNYSSRRTSGSCNGRGREFHKEINLDENIGRFHHTRLDVLIS